MNVDSPTTTVAPEPGSAKRDHSPPPRSRPSLPRATLPLPVRTSWYSGVKRAFDIVVALALMLLTAPLFVFGCLLVRLTSRGPVLYSQTRVGRGGKPFIIYKIRSMYHNCEQLSGARWSQKGDPRVMPVGRFLRRTHIDELPQLWNVLRGDMSLIGPRPERPEFVPQLEATIPHYRDRLLVLPGVTGLAQVHLGPDTDLASVERKLAMDLYYITRISCWTDLKILLATGVHVLFPYVVSKWIFGLTPQDCAESVARSRATARPVAAAAGVEPTNGEARRP